MSLKCHWLIFCIVIHAEMCVDSLWADPPHHNCSSMKSPEGQSIPKWVTKVHVGIREQTVYGDPHAFLSGTRTGTQRPGCLSWRPGLARKDPLNKGTCQLNWGGFSHSGVNWGRCHMLGFLLHTGPCPSALGQHGGPTWWTTWPFPEHHRLFPKFFFILAKFWGHDSFLVI